MYLIIQSLNFTAAPEPQSPPPPTTKPDGGKKCVNKKDTCDAWKGQGFCKPGNEWFDYMQEECCLACNGIICEI